MKKNPVTKLRINGRDWTVHLKPEVRDGRGEQLLGMCEPDKRKISVSTETVDLRTVKDTALHEVLHAAIPEFTEEQIVRLEVALGAVLLENRGFVLWYLED